MFKLSSRKFLFVNDAATVVEKTETRRNQLICETVEVEQTEELTWSLRKTSSVKWGEWAWSFGWGRLARTRGDTCSFDGSRGSPILAEWPTRSAFQPSRSQWLSIVQKAAKRAIHKIRCLPLRFKSVQKVVFRMFGKHFASLRNCSDQCHFEVISLNSLGRWDTTRGAKNNFRTTIKDSEIYFRVLDVYFIDKAGRRNTLVDRDFDL